MTLCRSVSLCPPAYYAHHAAFRARLMVDFDDNASDDHQPNATAGDMMEINAGLKSMLFYL